MFQDTLSGLTTRRLRREKLLATAALGDTVIIPAPLTMVRDVKVAGVGLLCRAEPMIETTSEVRTFALGTVTGGLRRLP